MKADIKQKVVVPAHMVSTQLRPDVVLWSNVEKVVYFVELTGRIGLRKSMSLKKLNMQRSYTARLECQTEACGGGLLWFCCKIYCFFTQCVRRQNQREQVNGCG